MAEISLGEKNGRAAGSKSFTAASAAVAPARQREHSNAINKPSRDREGVGQNGFYYVAFRGKLLGLESFGWAKITRTERRLVAS